MSEPYSAANDYTDYMKEMMQTAQEQAQRQATESMARTQDIVVDAVKAWSQSVQKLIPAAMPKGNDAPSPTDAVDSGFKIAEQLLAAQHQFARRLLEAAQPAAAATADAAAEAAESATGGMKQTIKKMRGNS